MKIEELCDEDRRPLSARWWTLCSEEAKSKRHHSLVLQVAEAEGSWVVCVNDGRLARQWVFLTSLDGDLDAQVDSLSVALDQLIHDKAALLWPQGAVLASVDTGLHVKALMTWRCRRVCRLNLPCLLIRRPRPQPAQVC